MADAPNDGLTPAQTDEAREAFAPLFHALCGQGGSSPVIHILNADGSPRLTIVAARLRRMRRALWPSAEYEALADPYRQITHEGEAVRRAVRARLYPEPIEGDQ